MDLQHAPEELPGAQELLANPLPNSLADAINSFQTDWVQHQSFTTRRTYERIMVLFTRYLAEQSMLHLHAGDLPADVLETHIAWRTDRGMATGQELRRLPVVFKRFSSFCQDRYS